MRMRMKSITYALIAIALLLSGCTKDDAAATQQEKGGLKVQIKTRAYADSEEGVNIEKVRFMIFINGTLSNNYTTSNGTLQLDPQGEFNIAVAPGLYHFATIVNETPELTEKLNAVSKYTDISAIKYDWQGSALTAQNLPLFNQGEMKITASSTPGQYAAQLLPTYNADGTRYTGSYSAISTTVIIDMPRALSQVSLFLRKGDAVTEKLTINSVQVVNIPHYGFLTDQLDTESKNLNLFTGPEKEILSSGGDKVYNSKQYHSFSSAIIAEKSFREGDQDNADKATNPAYASYLFINATYGGVPTTYKVLLGEGEGEGSTNFRLLRNTNYNVYATITQIGGKGIYVIIEPVKMHNITINWSPVEGPVIISDREADFNKNVNIWSDYAAYSGILKVYKGDTYYDVLFKYGSLIATNNDLAATSEQNFTPPISAAETSDVIWFPGGFDVMSIADWNSIPYISDKSGFTSGNTETLVEKGIGDPCRLAALSPHQIGVEKKIDNQQWHMATPAEYAILEKAANGPGSENADGYRSFHELLIPNVKYRNETGVLQSAHNNQGNYWTTEANQSFFFNSNNLSQTGLTDTASPTRGYTVRCVRNTIPEADITITPPILVYYYGTAELGSTFYVDSNVPYWKMELIKSGQGVGTGDSNDFSFAPLIAGSDVKHEFIGSYSQTPKAYIKRKESRTEDRSFGVKFTSMHFNGETNTYYFTITQYRYSIRGELAIDNLEANNRLNVNGGNYTMHITLTPNDVPMPVGAKLKIDYSYHGTLRGTSEIVTTTATDKYEYETKMQIQKNDTPDVIGLRFAIYMDEGSGYREIGNANYYQNN